MAFPDSLGHYLTGAKPFPVEVRRERLAYEQWRVLLRGRLFGGLDDVRHAGAQSR